MTALKHQHYDFTTCKLSEIPAYFLAENDDIPKYRRELARRVAELRRQDELERAAKQVAT